MMSANPSVAIPTTGDTVPNYPGFGSQDDIQARIQLLDWIREQIENGNVQVKVGDHILATEGRILGVSDDPEELHRRVVTAEPDLCNARLVGYFVPLSDY